ncbi:MAG: bifunctional DNA primase/polymerase [Mycobacterium sp.]
MLPDPDGRRERGDGGDLTVPDVVGLSLEEAALAYAEAGWYVLPTDSADIKNPGSVVGGRWHELSSRDPERIRRWWSANSNYGIALHCGRSGAVVFDLDSDDFETVPGPFVDALQSADAIQLTRLTGDRGHYVFAMPPSESLSNRAGAFAAYGEVRGKNGVVIAAPTPHPDGGDYHWAKTGPVVAPPPGALRECLSTASTDDVEPLTDTAFEEFLRAHDQDGRPGAMSVVLKRFDADVAAGVSRHYAMVKALGFGYRDAIAGYYPARRLTDALSESFHAASNKTLPGRRRPRPGSDEFLAAARYVAAEEGGADPDELGARKDGFADVENFKLARRALAPGGRWHPDTLAETLRALPVEPAVSSGGRYRLVTARELAEPVAPMRWLVRGIWPERSAGVLAGDKKSMKTWTLQTIAVAVAAGGSLFDKYHVTSPGPVLYLAGEGGRRKRRVPSSNRPHTKS